MLGGGPAGLAVGYYGGNAGLSCIVLEANERPGGNCTTFRHGDFLFDSGAHRFHDQDDEITADVRALLGEELRQIEVPSYIYSEGVLVDFPLSPLNLLRRLGPLSVARAAMDLLAARTTTPGDDDFESLAVSTYGRSIASRFLLNYSEKLWGLPCDRLSPDVAGKRLKGLDLRAFLAEAFGGRSKKDRHMDGTFWYPRLGYGCIADAVASACTQETVRCCSRITRIHHDRRRITSVVVNGSELRNVDEVVSTLPLDLFLRVLDPPPPAEILALVGKMSYRNVLLAAFFLDRPSVHDAGTVYFPEREFPFTRIYEPRNRSADLSPAGKTSLIAEIPCSSADPVWHLGDDEIVATVQGPLESIGWLRPSEILDTTVRRLPFAYPVLDAGYAGRLAQLHEWLAGFSNLRFSGRSGRFRYAWLHDMMRFGKDIVAETVSARR